METVGLKVGDIDSGRGVIRVEHGKGDKDRTVMLSAQLLRICESTGGLAKPRDWLFPARGCYLGLSFGACGRLSG
ncbi:MULTISPECIES: tyrosine-type recombinase/integrase [unclassified Mesorhizobium]|uniref:tyrosine-type recombinase/integrase n=1 Tax=unclassified Mesorhizobium TaxID=325217 RepID=UPI001FE03A3B|nr:MULTISPECIES: tyrosine-type recombinase/integrase [unclassified Mesorhizobium]